jgi:hypothetical protein
VGDAKCRILSAGDDNNVRHSEIGHFVGKRRAASGSVAGKVASGAVSGSDASGVRECGVAFSFTAASCVASGSSKVARLPLPSRRLLLPLFSRSLLVTGPAPRRFPWLRLPRRGVANPLRTLFSPFLFALLTSFARTTLHCLCTLSPVPRDTFYLLSLPALSHPRADPFGPVLTPRSLPSVGGVPISSQKRKLLHDQSRRVFPSVVQSRPSQRFPQRGYWPTFPTRSPGGASRPRRVLRSSHSLPGGGQVASSHFPPIRKRSSRGG